MSMQLLTYLSGGLPGLILIAGHRRGVSLRRPAGDSRHADRSAPSSPTWRCQMRFLPPMQALMGLYANLATARVSLRRVSEILDVPVEVETPAAPVRLPSVRGDIAFENVTPVVRSRRAGARTAVVRRARRRSAGDRRRERQRQVDDRRSAAAAHRSRRAASSASTGTICATGRSDRSAGGTWRSSISSRSSCTRRSPRTSATRGPARRTPRWRRRAREAALDSFIDGLPQRLRDDRRRARRGAVGRRAAADRDCRAGVPRGSGGSRSSTSRRAALDPRIRAPDRRGLRGRDARPDDDRRSRIVPSWPAARIAC